MISTYGWIKIYHLTLIAYLHYLTKLCSNYLHFLYNLTIKYGINEQISRTEQVIYGHGE